DTSVAPHAAAANVAKRPATPGRGPALLPGDRFDTPRESSRTRYGTAKPFRIVAARKRRTGTGPEPVAGTPGPPAARPDRSSRGRGGRERRRGGPVSRGARRPRSEEHTSELQSRENLVCRLLLEKK